MAAGIVFDIEEFAVYDGPGIRTVVFLKGCPLRCRWCHNPESFSKAPQRLKSRDLCTHCGACRAACPKGLNGDEGAGGASGGDGADTDRAGGSEAARGAKRDGEASRESDARGVRDAKRDGEARRESDTREACDTRGACDACGACVKACPRGALRIAGREMTAAEVSRRVLKNARALTMSGGGVTFSGGEALMQPDFVIETRAMLGGLNAAIETSGYAEKAVFRRVVQEMNLVLMDVKLADPAAHKKWIGADNALILENLAWLKDSGIPFRARVPLIPSVTDARENLAAIARLLDGARNLERVELMRYNRAAGAKYAQTGLFYKPDFPEDQTPDAWAEPFTKRGMEVITL